LRADRQAGAAQPLPPRPLGCGGDPRRRLGRGCRRAALCLVGDRPVEHQPVAQPAQLAPGRAGRRARDPGRRPARVPRSADPAHRRRGPLGRPTAYARAGGGAGMIRFEDVTITYAGARRPALQHVNLELPEGELTLVVGRTGAGKSTLLRAINGLVPHFTGGHLEGRVTVDGLDTRDHPPRELAHVVGMVGQDPLAGFVTDTVEEELAYGMEQLALPPEVMRKRVEETLDLLGIAELRRRPLRTLSGGQQQRVAIGSVLTMG